MPGHVALVLHAHLPFVRHPEHEDFLEEDWLYEAISETYLPLLQAFDRLVDEGIPFRVTLTLTPPLVAMLRDPLLMGRYARRLDRLCELADKEVSRTRQEPALHPIARFYEAHFAQLRNDFHGRYQRDLVGAFARLEQQGRVEIITCNATHGYLPLLQPVPEAVRAQVAVGAASHRRVFGHDAPGIWLAECGYVPGVEELLARENLRYFFVDSHGLMDAQPRPLYGVYEPLYTEAGVAAFARDPESSRQVWSREVGYPGDPLYREFYRDIGWDLPLDYVRPYVQPTGDRKNTGIKYHRITGPTDEKEPYDPAAARARAIADAEHFCHSRAQQLAELSTQMPGRAPIAVAPYDAELFGHWWFEGPIFLEHVLRFAAREGSGFSLLSPSDYLRAYPDHQVAAPAASSWGEEGYSRMWLSGKNDWIYPHLHECATRMVALARDFPDPDPLQKRALNQAARELLLAQSSDWAFILATGTMVEYATKRTREHVLRFQKLHDQVRAGTVDEAWLAQVEEKNNLFQDLDFRVYRP
jgi:1,4-alpha-glucan branching enzyme